MVALEQLNRSFAASDATEGFGFVLRIFDVFVRIVNNFKTGLKGLTKSLKRSELKAYHESYTSILNQFFRNRRYDTNLMVPIPSGMKVGYLQASSTLEDLYNTLAIQETIATLKAYFSSVQNTEQIPSADSVTATINKLTKDGVETTLRGAFSANKTVDVPVGTVISSFEELVSIDQHVLGYEKIFQIVSPVCESLDLLETQIDWIVTGLEKQKTPVDKIAVQSLYNLVKTASVQMDMFGVILAELQRVEHNFVLTLKKLVASSH